MVPLSFAQLRLWFLGQLEGPSPTYNVPLVWRLRGDLDCAALVGAVGDLMGRHESLRTVFPAVNGVPFQQVVDMDAAGWNVVVESVQESAVAAAVDAAVGCVFDLAVDIPIRVWLFRVREDEHVLVVVVHHIAGDGWSAVPMHRDLGVAYRARVAGGEPGWVPLPVQYADYALWQRELLGERDDPGSEMSRLVGYWTSVLAGIPEQLDLPVDRPRPAVSSYRGDVVEFAWDRDVCAGLVRLARAHGVTLFMVLQAGFAALLTRMGAGSDIPIGTPVAGRLDEALHELVGFFVNTLVLRTDTSGDPSFAALLARVREVDLAAYEHQELPFEQLVEAIKPTRSTAHHPLFQVMLTLDNNPADRGPDLPGIGVVPERFAYHFSPFDLTAGLWEHRDDAGGPGRITGILQFATDVFDRTTIEALAQRFRRLLDQVVADPTIPLSELDVLLPDERHQLLTQFNDTAVRIPDTIVPQLFEAQAERTPDAEAVVFAGTVLTYAELAVRVNRVAGLLVEKGAGAEQIVAVALPRSIDLVVTLLAVLKTGAAYLPIDPDHPTERLRTILEESRPVILVAAPEHKSTLSTDTTGVLTNEDLGGGSAGAVLSVKCDVNKQNPAYVIYTSGSTGRPKGVVVPHEAMVNLLLWTQERFELRADDRVLLNIPIVFDPSVMEMFWPLVQGATLVLAEPDGHRDPTYLAALMQDRQVTTVVFVPSMLQIFLAESAAVDCTYLRRVICGGETFPRALQEQFFRTFQVPLYNLYGPTETAVAVTAWRCDTQVAEMASVPIGAPLWNTRIYVLDAALEPVPIGVPGELYLAGAQLARGYVRQPSLTAERFVANPFGPPGARMYRTGDRARWTPDGNLVFLGRTDDQVKIRGIRIEPGEISSVLAGHSAVEQATVVVREQRLVAYLVPETDSVVERWSCPEQLIADLRTTVSARLPDYMAPTDYVLLDSFPTSRNGKLDRSALPAPIRPGQTHFRAPRTPREEILCDLFAEVLGLERVGIDDNFFELGGHSLLAAQLTSTARASFGIELGVASLFRTPTVAQLSELSSDAIGDFAEVLLPIRPRGEQRPLIFVHPVIGLSWCYAGFARHMPGVPLFGLQARGISAPERSPKVLEEMADDYLEQIRTIQPEGPYRLAGWSFGGNVAHAMATLLQDRGEGVELLALFDSYPYAGVPPTANHEKAGTGKILQAPKAPKVDFSMILRQLGQRAADELTPDRIAMIIEVRSQNGRLFEQYKPQVFRGNVVFFRARDQEDLDTLKAVAWQEFVSGEIDVHSIGTGHDEMLQAQPLAEIAAVLRRCIGMESQ